MFSTPRLGTSIAWPQRPCRSSGHELLLVAAAVDVVPDGRAVSHLCTVGEARIDPVGALGILPGQPLPYWGWGDIPDQYGRRWDGDDGESPQPTDRGLADLPPLRPYWGTGSAATG